MATLVNQDGKWTGNIQLTKQSGTAVTLATSTQYVDKPIVLNLSAKSATPTFKGGDLTDKTATGTFTNATTSTTDTSGVSLVPHASVTRSSFMYAAAVSGWVEKAINISPSGGASTSASWDGTNVYITGVTLTNGKSFDITVPNGAEPAITFHFSVDNNGNTTVTSG